MIKLKLLFVCTSGYRASIVSTLFDRNNKYESKSCGIYSLSEEELLKSLNWADKIICITDEHYSFIKDNFDIKSEKLINLDIPNEDSHNPDLLLTLSKKKLVQMLA